MLRVAEPFIDQDEKDAVADAMARAALSGHMQDYIVRFERGFAAYCGVEHGIGTNNGTTSIHLALAALGIGPGDEVLVSTYTNMATFFAVLYLGATPVPIDCEPETWNMNPALLERALTPHSRAIMPVHIFGHPVDMDSVLEIARARNLFVVEDAAQAHGAEYKGRKVGGLSDAASFSFYSNKVITTGEGGMVVTGNADVAERCRAYRNLCYGRENRFMHEDVGFNYRLSNLHAAVGWAQVNKIDANVAKKRQIAGWYRERLKHRPELLLPVERPWARSVYWMYHIVLSPDCRIDRARIMAYLAEAGIETRPGFVPFNMQKIAIERGLAAAADCPVANGLADRAFYVPSGVGLTEDQVDMVASALLKALGRPI
jgi:perosamine synthetase